MSRVLPSAARIAAPVLMLVVLGQRFGAQAFRPALAVFQPVPMLAALVLGGIATAAQAARWRVVMAGAGLRLEPHEALAEYYRAGALNAVLPGGVVGDVVRAWRRRTDTPRGWRVGAHTVIAERACGLCTLLGVATVVLVVVAPLAIAAASGAIACVAWIIARPALIRLSTREYVAVWGWSVLAVASLVTLTAVAAIASDVPGTTGGILTMGLVVLAGMALPLNIGGWGPREAAGALAAAFLGVPATAGVTVAAGYGLLATVSVLPGFLVLAFSGPAETVRRAFARSSSTQTSSPSTNRRAGARSASASRSAPLKRKPGTPSPTRNGAVVTNSR
jgi:glycosyltransferase 2 family protein